MTTDYTKLRQLAEAATPGPWLNAVNVGTVLTERMQPIVSPETVTMPNNSAYIAAANPAVVLGLLDRIAELEGEADR